MGQGDLLPIGQHRRKADPKRAQKIKEGGKRADHIHKQSENHHQSQEVPVAEAELMKDLEKIEK